MQENRSFDNLFQGYPGADTVSEGKDSKGHTVKLQPESLGAWYVIDHSAQAMFAACNGTGSLPGTNCKMNGFDQEEAWGGPYLDPEYVYVPHKESKPYFDMAHQGVVADRMFQSQLDESFVAHQYIIAAQAASAVNLPFGAWGCNGGKYDTVQHHHRSAQSIRTDGASLLRISDACRQARQSRTDVAFLRKRLRKLFERCRIRMVELQRDQAHLPLAGVEEKCDFTELEVHHRRARR